MLIAIIGKCVLTEVIMTIAIFMIDIVSRKVYKGTASGRNSLERQEEMMAKVE